MDSRTRLITYEMKLKRKNKINKMVLGTFLTLAILTLLARIVTGAILDAGFWGGHFHLGFWTNPEKSFNGEFTSWQHEPGNANKDFSAFLIAKPSIKAIISRHPNILWFTTQFTWITTVMIIVFLTFRFFRFEDRVPKWLKWIMRQRTLSLVTMYDMVVGVIFWASMFKGFTNAFADGMFGIELAITISVHAIIPISLLTYSIIYLIKDKKASKLGEFYAIKGMIYPGIYIAYYVVLTIIWQDPYPITNMHERLVSSGVTSGDWGAWAGQLWMLPAVLLVIYILLGFMTIVHNAILFKFNKQYDPEHDHDVLKRKEAKLERIKAKHVHKETLRIQREQDNFLKLEEERLKTKSNTKDDKTKKRGC